MNILSKPFVLQIAPKLNTKVEPKSNPKTLNQKVNPTVLSDFIKDVKKDTVVDIVVKPSKHTVYYTESNGSYNVSEYPDTNEFWRVVLNSGSNVVVDYAQDFQIQDGFSLLFFALLIVSGFQNDYVTKPRYYKPKTTVERGTRHIDPIQRRGIDEAKSELNKIVGFLREPEKYWQFGREGPQGCAFNRGARHRQNVARSRDCGRVLRALYSG